MSKTSFPSVDQLLNSSIPELLDISKKMDEEGQPTTQLIIAILARTNMEQGKTYSTAIQALERELTTLKNRVRELENKLR